MVPDPITYDKSSKKYKKPVVGVTIYFLIKGYLLFVFKLT